MMPIYFDHAATTPVLPEAAQAALHAMTQDFGNPSSRHRLGEQATAQLKHNRAVISAALGSQAEELFFTSGGTESDNWAIAIATAHNRRHGKHIITTAIEHAAVLEPLKALEQQGYALTYLQPDKSGHIHVEQVEEVLREDTILVSMMLVNNETGALLPVRETANLLRRRKSLALLHSDAVQAFLKIPFTPKDLGVDLLSISAHKVGGTKGCGALYVRKELKPTPLLRGGGQEQGLRSGTEATPQIAAFSVACTAATEQREAHDASLRALKAYALDILPRTLPELVVVSAGDAPHICAVSLPGYPSEMLVRALSERDIFVSSGSACHKGKPSHVFAAMKLPHKVLQGILRLSFSAENTKDEVDTFAAALAEIASKRIAAR